MGLVALLVVLDHLPKDIKLSFMPNYHVADVKYLVFLKVHVYLYDIRFIQRRSVFYII